MSSKDNQFIFTVILLAAILCFPGTSKAADPVALENLRESFTTAKLSAADESQRKEIINNYIQQLTNLATDLRIYQHDIAGANMVRKEIRKAQKELNTDPADLAPRPEAAATEPEPVMVAPKPLPAPVVIKPEPPAVAPKPLPAPVVVKPEPPAVAPKPLPAPVVVKPEPPAVAPKPLPAPVVVKPEPPAVAPKPLPAPVVVKPEPPAVAPKPAAKPVVARPEPVIATPKPAPKPVVAKPEPVIVPPKPAPQPVVARPEPVAPKPAPKPELKKVHTPQTRVSSVQGLAGNAKVSQNNVYSFELSEIGASTTLAFWGTGLNSLDSYGKVWLITPDGKRLIVGIWKESYFEKPSTDVYSYYNLKPITENISKKVTGPGTYKIEFEWTNGKDPLVIYRVEITS
jgi:hypothetical protein